MEANNGGIGGNNNNDGPGLFDGTVNLNEFSAQKIFTPREEDQMLNSVTNDHGKMISILKYRSDTLLKG